MDWDAIRDTLTAAGIGIAGASGTRALWVCYQLREKDRPIVLATLGFEALVAVVMGLTAIGVAEWLGLTGWQAFSLAGAFGWLGPKGMEALIIRYVLRGAGQGRDK